MNIRKKFSGQIIIIKMMLIFMVFTLISSFGVQIKKVKEYKNEIVSLNGQIQNTKAQISDLKKEGNNSINGDLESIARNRLNMVKPNEIVYIDVNREGN
ncbi:MAG: FtsB family cell division protein [Peptostreptococcaceae bacterium]